MKIWKAVQDPKFMRTFNGYATIFWVIMIPISIVTGWISSVVYVAALSIWALVSGHLSAWTAGRVEVKQHDDADVQDVLDILKEMRDRHVEPIQEAEGSGNTTDQYVLKFEDDQANER